MSKVNTKEKSDPGIDHSHSEQMFPSNSLRMGSIRDITTRRKAGTSGDNFAKHFV
jgi:hypothetical protein